MADGQNMTVAEVVAKVRDGRLVSPMSSEHRYLRTLKLKSLERPRGPGAAADYWCARSGCHQVCGERGEDGVPRDVSFSGRRSRGMRGVGGKLGVCRRLCASVRARVCAAPACRPPL